MKTFLLSGWRPFFAWVCGMGLFYQLLIYPWLVALAPDVQSLDNASLISMVSGILGLGGLRSIEKTKGVASK